MNRIFRIIRNPLTGQCAVASELAPQRGNRVRRISAIAAGVATCLAPPAMATVLNGDHHVSGVSPSYPWTHDTYVEVGKNGHGNLLISEGVEMPAASSMAIGVTDSGATEGGEGTVSVSGRGASLSTNYWMTIGESGHGSLRIEDGGSAWSRGHGFVGYTEGSSGYLSVSGVGSTFRNSGYFMVGGLGAYGELDITDGGLVTSDSWAFVGDAQGSEGVVNVNGAGQWWSKGDLVVGYEGKGALNITNGGSVLANQQVFVGGIHGPRYPDSEGEIFVSGAGSVLRVDGPVGIIVGAQGPGRLSVTDGGVIDSGVGVMLGYVGGQVSVTNGGHLSGRHIEVGTLGEGLLTVTDGGSVRSEHLQIALGDAPGQGKGQVYVFNALLSSSRISVGASGEGRLDIGAGGTVLSEFGDIGRRDFSNGSVAVLGQGARWVNSQALDIGSWGQGRLIVTNDGSVSAGAEIVLGKSWGSLGSADVSNGGKLVAGEVLNIGQYGAGALTVGAGGAVSSANAVLGDGLAGKGLATVSGAGAQWTNVGYLAVGNAGDGALRIADGGGVATIGKLTVGSNWTGEGRVDVSDGGDLFVDGRLAVAASGAGYLSIAGGGNVHSVFGTVGEFAGSRGSVTVAGAGAQWTNTGNLTIGEGGYGSLDIGAGGTVSSGNALFGQFADGEGVATVAGADARWNAGSNLGIGGRGKGTLDVGAGATVSNGDAWLGMFAGSEGSARVSGADARWVNTGALSIGEAGKGALSVEAGGSVSSGTATLGHTAGSKGSATVAGDGATWSNAGRLNVGDAGNGVLTIAEGGHVAADNLLLAGQAGSSGVVNIGNGGMAGLLDAIVVDGGDGVAVVNFNHTDVTEFAPKLTGSLALNVLADGITTLLAQNDYRGTTSVLAGTLRAGSAGAFSAASHHLVAADAQLQLGGFNQHIASLDNTGTIAFAGAEAVPGTVLTVHGDYVGNGGVLQMNAALGGDDSLADRMVVEGDTSGHSWVQVSNVGGAGGLTQNGIQLIAVNGASRGVFEMQGRAVAGLYEYWLYKGGRDTPEDGGWYLRSELPPVDPADPVEPVDPIDPIEPVDPVEPVEPVEPIDPIEPVEPIEPIEPIEPVDPTEPVQPIEPVDPINPLPPVDPGVVTPPAPVLRPEPGAYLGNQIAALRMFRGTLHDRTGEQNLTGDGTDAHDHSVWMRTQTGVLNAGAVDGQIEMRVRTDAVQLGVEKQFALGEGRLHAGVMGGHGRATTEAVSLVSHHRATGTVKGSMAGIYGTWFQQADGTPGAYVDVVAQYARFDNTVKGSYLGRETYDTRTWSLSMETGRAFQLHAGKQHGVYIEPQVQVIHTGFSSGDVREANGTLVRNRRSRDTTTRLGARLYGRELGNEYNRVQPFVAINWWSGGATASVSMDQERLDHDLPGSVYEAKLGVQLELGKGWSGWGQMGYQRGGGSHRDVGGQLGLKLGW